MPRWNSNHFYDIRSALMDRLTDDDLNGWKLSGLWKSGGRGIGVQGGKPRGIGRFYILPPDGCGEHDLNRRVSICTAHQGEETYYIGRGWREKELTLLVAHIRTRTHQEN